MLLYVRIGGVTEYRHKLCVKILSFASWLFEAASKVLGLIFRGRLTEGFLGREVLLKKPIKDEVVSGVLRV